MWKAVPQLPGVMITNAVVEQACNEVSGYSEEQMASEFERFFTTQPDLCDFVSELTSESDQKIQELSLFLSYMVFKAVEKSEPRQAPRATREAIETAFHESENWIEKVNEVESGNAQASILSNISVDAEPHLLQYVISEINQPMDDETQLGDEQKGEVFFVLKTVISTLARRSIVIE